MVCSLSLAYACGKNKKDEPGPLPPPNTVDLTSVADLIVTFTTRSGVTTTAYAAELGAAAKNSAQAFQDSLGNGVDLTPFVDALPTVLQTFRTNYQAAADVDAKATSVDQLMWDVIQAAGTSGITPEQLDLAVLASFVDLQPKLSQPPFSTFTDADRELVNLLMIMTTNQLHQRAVLNRSVSSMASLSVDPILSDHLLQTVDVLEAALPAEFRSVEGNLADSLISSSSGSLITMQWNSDAMNDLLLFRFSMELSLPSAYPGIDGILARIIGNMQASSGIMSGMTVTDLVQSGISSSIDPYWTIEEYIAYDWVKPGALLSYQTDTTLADELVGLGGTVPDPPDYTYFADPYLSVFRIKYDFDLCNAITWQEWTLASGATTTLPKTMATRYDLLQSRNGRAERTLARFNGGTAEERVALRWLFMGPIW